MTRLHIDLESFSRADIKAVGAFRYAQDPSTEILMMGYAIDDYDPQIWFPQTENMPWDLLAVLNNGECTVHAFNAQFERAMLQAKMPSVHSLIHPMRWRCTMIEAYALSFSGGLDDVAKQIGLPFAKDPRGQKLIQRFSQMQPASRKVQRWTQENDPVGFMEFADYCQQDVVVERAVWHWVKRRYNLPPQELHHAMFRDWDITSRGVCIDRTLVAAAQVMRDNEFQRIDQELTVITGMANANSPTQIRHWMERQGVYTPTLRAEDVVELLGRADLPPVVRRVLELRQQRSLSSLAKFDALQRATCADGRLRGVLQTRGASRTGRYAGRIFQPQNLPRGAGEGADAIIDAVKHGSRQEVLQLTDSIPDALSSIVRGCVVPTRTDQRLVIADYSSIESRVLGWLADCPRINNTFADGLDTYKDFATVIFNCAYDDVTKKQRSYAKPPTLGCGYRLGGSGLVAYAHGMGVTMLESDAARVVKLYREAYPEIPRFWYWIENAIIEACAGAVVTGYRLQLWRDEDFLYIQLPSGRKLCYYKPEVRMEKMHWGGEKLCMSYMGQDSRTKQWVRIKSHGGISTENIVQAIAYDVLVVGINRCVQKGLDVVLHVHDEIIVEADVAVADATLDLMIAEMSRAPLWGQDLLLGAAGYTTYHYRKD